MEGICLKKLKRQRVVLDILPFSYNFLILITWFIEPGSSIITIIGFLFGFSLKGSVDLYLRSIDNSYCFWHQVPIFNMMMIVGFNIILIICKDYFNYNLLTDPEYPILFYFFIFWILIFLISIVFFFGRQIIKLGRRCVSLR